MSGPKRARRERLAMDVFALLLLALACGVSDAWVWGAPVVWNGWRLP